MKKALKIAKYDFKRLMLNPITLICLAIVLGVVFICGLAVKLPTAESLKVSYSQSTSSKTSFYNAFNTSSGTAEFDSKAKIKNYVNKAMEYINAQSLDTKNGEVIEVEDLNAISREIIDNNLTEELKRINSGDLSNQTHVYTLLQNLSDDLKDFLTNYDAKNQFTSKLVFTKDQHKKLNQISNFLTKNLTTISNIPLIAKQNITGDLLDIINNKIVINIDKSILQSYTKNYVETSEKKLGLIVDEMRAISQSTEIGDAEGIEKIKNYIKEYKLVAQMTEKAVISEMQIILNKLSINIDNLYNFSQISLEDAKQNLAEAKYYITLDSLEYKEYQRALNFGNASSQVTAFDHSYFVVSIVGFLTILFGMFCAYKLYGKDKKNGKLDLLLSQKVKFSEVFAGKFMATLFCTMTILASFTILSLIWGSILYALMPESILAVFNLQSAYTINPFLFLIIKVCGIELQVIFWTIVTIFAMNISRKFLLSYGITIGVFVVATILNLFLNNQLWYCLLPFIHIDMTSMLGGATMQTGFLKTSLYAYGNFYISIIYYLVVIGLLYNFTKQLFKKN